MHILYKDIITTHFFQNLFKQMIKPAKLFLYIYLLYSNNTEASLQTGTKDRKIAFRGTKTDSCQECCFAKNKLNANRSLKESILIHQYIKQPSSSNHIFGFWTSTRFLQLNFTGFYFSPPQTKYLMKLCAKKEGSRKKKSCSRVPRQIFFSFMEFRKVFLKESNSLLSVRTAGK